MKTDPWKDQIHAALQVVVDGGVDIPVIARQTGLSDKSLYAFASKRTLHRDKLRILAQWMKGEGYLPSTFRVMEAPAAYGSGEVKAPSIAWLTGQDLINLGLWLQSDVADDLKLEKYEIWVQNSKAILKAFRSELEKRSE